MPNSQQLVDPDGQVRDVPEADVPAALAAKWTLPTPEDTSRFTGEEAAEQSYGGVAGGAKALGYGVARGVSVGLSDLAFRAGGASAEHLSGLAKHNPTPSIAGEVIGGLVPALAAPGSILARTPAGAISKIGRSAAEAGEYAAGGIAGKIATNATGAAIEGGTFGGGQYVSQVALEDKPLSAEGFVGGIGTGALFGGVAGGAFTAAGSALSGAAGGLQRVRSLFPKRTVSQAAAQAVDKEAASAVATAVTDGDAMVEAVKKRLAITESKIGMASAGEGTTRRVFGQADPQALGDQVAGGVERTQMADAVRKYEASRAQLADWIREEADPSLESALTGLRAPDLGVEGPWKAKRYEPQQWPPELPDAAGGAFATAPTQAPLEVRADSLGDALDMRARQLDVTNVGRAPRFPSAAKLAPEPVSAAEYKALREVPGWSEKTLAKLGSYSGNDEFIALNRALRAGAPDARQAALADDIEAAISRSPSPRDATVFRWVTGSKSGTGSDAGLYANLKVGDEFTERAFSSTTTDEAIARREAISNKKLGWTGTVLKIEVPKGSPLAAIPSEFAETERELLMPRGVKYRVTKIDPPKDGLRVVHVAAEPPRPRVNDDIGELLGSSEARAARAAADPDVAIAEALGGTKVGKRPTLPDAPESVPYRHSADRGEFEAQAKRAFDSLPADEQKAVVGVADGGFRWDNEQLRLGNKVDTDKIDAAIARHTAAEDFTIYRGLDDRGGGDEMMRKFSKLAVGDEFSDAGVQSAYVVNGPLKYHDVRLTIAVPKGAKVLPLNIGPDPEVLLPRGARYVVDSITTSKITPGGTSIPQLNLRVRMIPEGAASAAPAPAPTFVRTNRPAGGSQGGAWYKDQHGDDWFGKHYRGDVDRIEGEALASRIYRTMGVDAPEARVVDVDGRRMLMSKDVNGDDLTAVGSHDRTNARDGFVVDSWLANWDAVGLSNDNMLAIGNRAARIDNGGATIWRAMGERKPFKAPVAELETMRDPRYPAGAVFGKLSKTEIEQQIVDFAANYKRLAPKIDKLVDESGLSAAAKKEIRDGLKERAEWLIAESKKVRSFPISSADEVDAIRDATKGKWGEKTRVTIDHYVGDAYFDVNKALREGASADSEMLRGLDRITLESTTPRDMTLFRGVSGDTEGGRDFVAKFSAVKPGDTFADPGFLSLTADPMVAREFASQAAGAPGLEFHVLVPKGSHAAALPSLNGGEREILAARGSSFKVLTNEVKPDGGRIVRVEMMPRTGAAAAVDDIKKVASGLDSEADNFEASTWWSDRGQVRPIGGSDFADMKAKAKALDRAEVDSINHYSTDAAYKINAQLRSGKLSAVNTEHVKNLDAALSKSATAKAVRVFRGIPEGEAQSKIAALRPGETFEDAAFNSSSLDPDAARLITTEDRALGSSLMMVIDVPKGYPAVAVAGESPLERELILKRGTKYKIISNEIVPASVNSLGDAIPPERVIHVSIVDSAGSTAKAAVDMTDADFQSLATKMHGEVDEEVLADFRTYADTSHINGALREFAGNKRVSAHAKFEGDPINYLEQERPGFGDVARTLDSEIAESKLPKRATLYRGVNGNTRQYDIDLGALKVGDSFVDPAYVSTSTSRKEVAKEYAKGSGVRPGYILEIDAPAGTAAYPMPSGNYNWEKEVLLPRGVRFQVVGREVSDDGHTVLKLRIGDDAAAPVAAAAPAPPQVPDVPVGAVVERSGRPSLGIMEATLSDGSKIEIPKGTANDWAQSRMPEGFTFGVMSTSAPFRIRQDIPIDASDVHPNSVHVIKPSSLVDRGVMGNQIHPQHAASMKAARADAKVKLGPIEIDVTPDGKLYIEDGNHRLNQAAITDAPVAVRFRPAGPGWTAQSGAHDVTDRLRGLLPVAKAPPIHASLDAGIESLLAGATKQLDIPPAQDQQWSKAVTETKIKIPPSDAVSSAPVVEKGWHKFLADNIGKAWKSEGSYAAGVSKLERDWAAKGGKPAASLATAAGGTDGDLESLLSGTKGKLDAGEDLNAMGAPARAEYAAAKAERSAADAERFRAKATESNRAPEPMIADDVAADGAPIGLTPEDVGAAVQRAAPPTQAPSATETIIKGGRSKQRNPDRTVVDRELREEMRTISDDEKIAQILKKHIGKNVDVGPDMARAAKAIGDYEQASADLVEILGAEAPAIAAANAKGLKQAAAGRADADALAIAKAAGKMDDSAGPQLAQKPGGVLGIAADAGAAMEVLQAMGVSVPDVDKIPVIGPVLSLFLKARAAMGILGRKGGSIWKSADGAVAARSAATVDRIAAATTATLNAAGRGAQRASAMAAGPAVTLAHKLFPGGSNPKSKDPRVLYEARMDELARASAPGAIDRAVGERIQTSDPNLQDAIVSQVERGLKFLDGKAPKQTVLPGMLRGDGDWKPSKHALEVWGRYVQAVNDPASVLEDLAKGHVTLEGAEVLRTVYPKLFAEAQRMLLELAPKMQTTLPYARRVMISIIYQVPVDISMTPEHMQFLQPPPPAPQQPGMPAPMGPPMGAPAIAGNLNIGQQTMTSLDRRAGM